MATTLTNLQKSISLRLGEDSVPTGNEYDRRTQFLNEAGKSIVRKHYWWWTETSTTFDSIADSATYTVAQGFPSNIRGASILELRFDGTLYTPALQSEVLQMTSSTYSGLSQKYFVFNKVLNISPSYGTTTVNGVAIKFYKVWTALTTGADECDVPDDFADILVAFALGRIQKISGKRGSSADAYDEFNEIYKEMSIEQNNYLFSLKSDELSELALYE
jgi:hypothetical protein